MAFPSLLSCCRLFSLALLNSPKKFLRTSMAPGLGRFGRTHMRASTKRQKYRLTFNSIANLYHPLGRQ